MTLVRVAVTRSKELEIQAINLSSGQERHFIISDSFVQSVKADGYRLPEMGGVAAGIDTGSSGTERMLA